MIIRPATLTPRHVRKYRKMLTAFNDIANALRRWPLWLWFAQQDIKSRYRGSLLGPIWLVLNLGILVAALSLIYATIFGMPVEVYTPHVGTGFIAWWYLSGVMLDACTAFTANAQIIRNMPLPIGIHVLRVLARHSVLMLHNMIVYLIIAVSFAIWPNANTLLVIIGYALVTTLLFSIGLCLAIICARYRDVPHIVASIVQVVMFITPIMFLKDMLQKRIYIANVNPFYHMIEAIRAPLLGAEAPNPSPGSFLSVPTSSPGLPHFIWSGEPGTACPIWFSCMSDLELSVEDVCLRFRIYGVGSQSLKKQLLSFGTGGRLGRDTENHFFVQALSDLTFKLQTGDKLGIMGANGAGKSTLLRILAGIYRPQSGTVKATGQLSAIIDPSVALDFPRNRVREHSVEGAASGSTPQPTSTLYRTGSGDIGAGRLPVDAGPYLLVGHADASEFRNEHLHRAGYPSA